MQRVAVPSNDPVALRAAAEKPDRPKQERPGPHRFKASAQSEPMSMRSLGRRRKYDLQRAFQIIRHQGLVVFIRKAAVVLRELAFPPTYKRWIARYDTLTPEARQRIAADIARLVSRPTISIVMPVDRIDRSGLQTTVHSLQAQLYPRWELWAAVDAEASEDLCTELLTVAPHDQRVRVARIEGPATWAGKANGALALATGDFVGLVEVGDLLAEHALYWVARETLAHPDADLIFSDEDTIQNGTRCDPWFKSDWNPALMLSHNAFGRLGLFRRSLVQQLGGFRPGYEGADEHHLVLRCAQRVGAGRIRHIARVLYHRRAGDASEDWGRTDSGDAGQRAIADYVAAQGIMAQVKTGRLGYQLAYPIPTPHPRVSVLIATTARPDILEPCLMSLFQRTTYDDFEVILLVNETVIKQPERTAMLRRFAKKPRVRIIEYPDRPFNYSWVNNLGAFQAAADILCFLNDDTEVITPDWLEQLVARVSLPQVAAAAPMLYYPDGTIQHAGVILGLGGIAGHACHREPRGSAGYFGRACLEQDVSCVTAACMAARTEVFRTLGGFDEALPLAYNDVDFCLRLRAAGWRLIWTPAAELVHHESISLGRHDSGPLAHQFTRDVLVMRRRWGALLQTDPFYNRNASLQRAFRLAFPPRLFTESDQAKAHQPPTLKRLRLTRR